MKKNDERNARYAIIEEGDVIVEYFTNSFIEGEFIGEVEFIEKCIQHLRNSQ